VTERTATGRSSRVASGVAVAKDVFSLLRDSVLFTAALLLLIFPATFNGILTDAGFEEGSFAGLKWKRQFFDTDAALRTAGDTIASLQNQNGDLLKALADAGARDGDATRKAELSKLRLEGRQTAEAAAQVQQSVRATLATNAPLVEKARPTTTDLPPSQAYCYQEYDGERYSLHCHTTQARCDTARGPNPRTKQSSCEAVTLDGAKWAPRHPGWMGSWYEVRLEPFGTPFPQIR
jgi:hypothetical protein